MKIITAGNTYLDIDSYGGIVAYAELLNKQGIEARAVSTGVLNESVSRTVRSWRVALDTAYEPALDDTFTLIDVSTPQFFDSFVDHNRIDMVIDHHPGFEAYWKERIGDGAHIELIGAACTLVYEYWEKTGLIDDISVTSARLLMCGILDNTLNFGAQISTTRDKTAYRALARHAGLPEDWPAQYFGEIQEAIARDPVEAIRSDTKTVNEFPSQINPIRIGQFAIWHAADILNAYQADLIDAYEKDGANWFINIISIGERKSYFLCANPRIQQWLSGLLDLQFNDSRAIADRLWLRKEIMMQDMQSANK